MVRCLVLTLLSGWALAQWSGIVNGYAAVTAFVDPATVTVDDPSPFSVGDRVMLYQAKGATINTTNNTNYGDITAINSAGIFEFNQIVAISGNNITFQCARVRPFGNPATDAIQLIRVAYSPGNITTAGLITAPAWDGVRGGVVVLEVDGTLTLGADISLYGLGFRGGLYSLNGGSTFACNAGTFHGAADDQAGRKGEGIATYPGPNHVAYRGKSANGGGGGNNHNTGGGGGSNYGAGGNGGWTTCGSRWFCVGSSVVNSGWGYGGMSLASYLSSSNLRAFMGGGGGGGHQNNTEGGSGGSGGGVVIIRAGAIVGGGFSIIAAGDSGARSPSVCGGPAIAGNDGAGGGGGGGSILLFCPSYVGTLTLDVRGGRGGSCSKYLCSCRPDHGPGGGGGGGYVGLSTSVTPAGLTLLTSGGANGIELTPDGQNMNNCNNTGYPNCITNPTDQINRGATPGTNGGTLFGISYTGLNPCPAAQQPSARLEVEPTLSGSALVHYEVRGLSMAAYLLVSEPSRTSQQYLLSSDRGTHRVALSAPGLYTFALQAPARPQGFATLVEKTLLYQPNTVLQGRHLSLWSEVPAFYQISTTQGAILISGHLPAGGSTTVSLEGLPAGLYWLQLEGYPPAKLLLLPD